MSLEIACSICGAVYALKPELIGRKVRCGQCQTLIDVVDTRAQQAYATDDGELELLDLSTESASPQAMAMPDGLLSIEDGFAPQDIPLDESDEEPPAPQTPPPS